MKVAKDEATIRASVADGLRVDSRLETSLTREAVGERAPSIHARREYIASG
jgi:hypothetical protein